MNEELQRKLQQFKDEAEDFARSVEVDCAKNTQKGVYNNGNEAIQQVIAKKADFSVFEAYLAKMKDIREDLLYRRRTLLMYQARIEQQLGDVEIRMQQLDVPAPTLQAETEAFVLDALGDEIENELEKLHEEESEPE